MLHYLTEKNCIGENGFYMSVYNSKINADYPHVHDFFELTLVTNGKVRFINQNKEYILSKGDLLLVWPNEIHTKEAIGESNQINLAYTSKVLYSLAQFLNDSGSDSYFFKQSGCILVHLTQQQLKYTETMLTNLYQKLIFSDGNAKELSRIILFEIMTKYILNKFEKFESSYPIWLKDALEEMKLSENFSEGLTALIRISQKSHSNLCQAFQKYMDTTPIEYINDLRLQYARLLLESTDEDIVEISLKCGFNNLSHFYHLFKAKYDVTPKKFRSNNLKRI